MDINIRELIYSGITEAEIWEQFIVPDFEGNTPIFNINATFDDETIVLTNRQLILSWYYWQLYVEFPGAPILSWLSIHKPFIKNTHAKIGASLIWHVFYNSIEGNDNLIWDISRSFYKITNKIYNMSCLNLSEYVTAMTVYDIIEIFDYPTIKKTREYWTAKIIESDYNKDITEEGVACIHKSIEDVIYTENPELYHNNLIKLTLPRITDSVQVIQMVGARGYCADVGGSVFTNSPILSCLIQGHYLLPDYAVSSREAAIALHNNNNLLSDSVYTTRECELTNCMIHSVVGESCNGFATVTHLVLEKEKELIKGKYHMVNGEPHLLWTKKGSHRDSIICGYAAKGGKFSYIEDLYGELINIRSITGCNNTDPQTVCKTCLGWIHNVIPPETNLGQMLTTEQTNPLTSNVLSTKHSQKSTKTLPMKLDRASKQWLELIDDGTHLIINPKLHSKRIKIYIKSEYVKLINHIAHVNPDTLPPSGVTDIKGIEIAICNDDGKIYGFADELKLEVGGSGIHLSKEMLNYLKKVGWLNNGNHIEIDLVSWNYNHPVFVVPSITKNMALILNDFISFLKYTMSNPAHLAGYNTREGGINAMYGILESDIPTSYPLLEIFVKGAMCKNPGIEDYTFPKANDTFKFVGYVDKLAKSSLSAALSYERQMTMVNDTRWESGVPLNTHLFDDIFLR